MLYSGRARRNFRPASPFPSAPFRRAYRQSPALPGPADPAGTRAAAPSHFHEANRIDQAICRKPSLLRHRGIRPHPVRTHGRSRRWRSSTIAKRAVPPSTAAASGATDTTAWAPVRAYRIDCRPCGRGPLPRQATARRRPRAAQLRTQVCVPQAAAQQGRALNAPAIPGESRSPRRCGSASHGPARRLHAGRMARRAQRPARLPRRRDDHGDRATHAGPGLSRRKQGGFVDRRILRSRVYPHQPSGDRQLREAILAWHAGLRRLVASATLCRGKRARRLLHHCSPRAEIRRPIPERLMAAGLRRSGARAHVGRSWALHTACWRNCADGRVFQVSASYLIGMWLLLQVAEVTFAPLHFPAWWVTALTILAVDRLADHDRHSRGPTKSPRMGWFAIPLILRPPRICRVRVASLHRPSSPESSSWLPSRDTRGGIDPVRTLAG